MAIAPGCAARGGATATDHRERPDEVRLGRGSADIAGWITGGVRAGRRQREGRHLRHSVWIVSTTGTDGPRRLTGSPRDTAPRWSPDGRHLAFVRAVEKDGRVQPPQIHIRRGAGGRRGRSPTFREEPPIRSGHPTDGRSHSRRRPSRRIRRAKDDDRTARTRKTGTPPERRAGHHRGRLSSEWRSPALAMSTAIARRRSGRPAPRRSRQAGYRHHSGEFAVGNVPWSAGRLADLLRADRRKEPYYLPGDSDLYSVSRTAARRR